MAIPYGEYIITNGQDPLTGEWFTGTRRYPFYSCGHCSRPIAFRSDRVRPREKCLSCDRFLCEKSTACMKGCTPIHALARDKWEAADKWTEHLPEIMGISPDQIL
jgi:hypothetical protein